MVLCPATTKRVLHTCLAQLQTVNACGHAPFTRSTPPTHSLHHGTSHIQTLHACGRAPFTHSTPPNTPSTSTHNTSYLCKALPHILFMLALWFFAMSHQACAAHLPCTLSNISCMRTCTIYTLYTPSHSLHHDPRHVLLSLGIPSHPLYACILRPATSSMCCTPALHTFKHFMHEDVHHLHTLHPLTLPPP